MTEELKLRELGVEGLIFLKMKADDTEFNARIHNAFRELAKIECKNDYTLALGKLLEYYQSDAKLEAFWFALSKLEERVASLELEAEKVVDEEDNGDTF